MYLNHVAFTENCKSFVVVANCKLQIVVVCRLRSRGVQESRIPFRRNKLCTRLVAALEDVYLLKFELAL